ncbi:MAG: DUF167 domain-containing protein [Chloroflexi bacterium]|nr:DUF167 domain-containing protein [Chloroflexota bacterium]
MRDNMLQVRVQPKSRRDAVEIAEGGKLKVYVTAAPEDGRANDAVVALLAKRLGVSKSAISIVRGHRSRDKVLRVDGMSDEEALERLSSA